MSQLIKFNIEDPNTYKWSHKLKIFNNIMFLNNYRILYREIVILFNKKYRLFNLLKVIVLLINKKKIKTLIIIDKK